MRRKGVNKEETRRKVLDSASKSFRKHGYAGIGVDYLAKSAGVTSGAIYSHFGSKEGAFDEVLAEGLALRRCRRGLGGVRGLAPGEADVAAAPGEAGDLT